ncbi:hypothetical protein [Rubritalea halochordaticola]|uniref:hypothetical protein n=1 Tax=Rubritalea halochordaticola TaxID=714537 RepID=UPI0031FC1880
MAKHTKAAGLVEHAKGKWIGGAKKGIAQAQAQLEKAGSDEQRQTAEAELAKWRLNLQQGLQALQEREQALEEAERDRPAAKKALLDAQSALAKTRENALQSVKALGLSDALQSDALDARLAKYLILRDATPASLALYAQTSPENQAFLESMLKDPALLVQMLVADGAKGGNYARAIAIYQQILQASPKAREGNLQRLALAISLEHAEPISQRNPVAAKDAPATVDPVKRYLQFEKAFLAGELDLAFPRLTTWDYRMVVDGNEPDETLVWGREMLRNYRPDHITTDDYRWRYVALVRTDIPYGSQDNQYDKDELQFYQNILMNGGICGRRAFIGRFILRAFGIPTTARPQPGHAALVHWTPEGWVICLGAGWGSGWTKTPYDRDRAFLATTQARALGSAYLPVKRAHWIADFLGEKQVWGFGSRHEPGFWNGLALYTQQALIEAADAKELQPVGQDIAEASDSKEKIKISQVEITADDRKIRTMDQVIHLPATATSKPNKSTRAILFMDSALGGKQLHYSRSAGSAEFEYDFQCQQPGKYALVAKVVTPSWQQNLLVTANESKQPVKIPLPHTVGSWQLTEPVAIDLQQGRNVLRFTRSSDGNPKGFSVKEFMLIPWENHRKVLEE